MNVGNSFWRRIGRHLLASYPYSADIGVGLSLISRQKVLLRPVILKWASVPRFSFYYQSSGTDDTILNFMDNITKQNGNEVGRHQVEGQTIIINQQERRSTNGLGTAGFILALLGLIFNWVPGLGWVLWALGLIFSFVEFSELPAAWRSPGLSYRVSR